MQDCYPLYKKLKKVAKFLNEAQEAETSQDFAECVNSAKKVLKNEPSVVKIRFHAFDKLCHCSLKGGLDSAEARKNCDSAIKISEEPRLLCDRAEAYLSEDMFDEVRLTLKIKV